MGIKVHATLLNSDKCVVLSIGKFHTKFVFWQDFL